MSICFMAGHAQAEEWLLPQIFEMAQHLIEQWGVTQFVVGHYGAFDRLAAQTIMQLKQRYPRIELLLLLPYYFQETERSGKGSYAFGGWERKCKVFAIRFSKKSFIL